MKFFSLGKFPNDDTIFYKEVTHSADVLPLPGASNFPFRRGAALGSQAAQPEPDRIWILNRSHITGSGLPDSVDPAQYPDKNPDIWL